MMLMLYVTISMLQLASLKEKMEYTVYSACRAASVADDRKQAEEKARDVATADLAGYSELIEEDGIDVLITPESGGSYPVKFVETDGASGSGTGKKGKGDGLWKKGNFVTCELQVRLNSNNVLLSGVKKCSITLAIEKSDVL